MVADKISRKTSVLIGWILFFLGSLSLLYLKNFGMLTLYSIITSIGVTFVSGALQAWFYDNFLHLGIEKEYRKFMKDAKSLAFPISAVTIAIGGFLAQFYGFKVPLILSILIDAVGIIVIASIPEYEFKKPEAPYHLHLLNSFRELLKLNIFWIIMVSIIRQYVHQSV